MKAGGKAPAVATEGTEPPDGFLSEGYLWFQFRRGLMKLAFMVAVTTFELYRYGVLTKGHFLALLSPLRWLAGLLLAARVASMICSQLLCRWVWWRDAPGLQGRVAVVTGGSAGVGHEAALQLALLGATVVIGVRSAQRGRAAEEALTSRIREKASQVPGAVLGRVEYVSLDLASLASVRAFAATVTTKYKRIDVLVNNAGINGWGVQSSDGLTRDGVEEVFGVNYLGHWLLTQLLLPALNASARHHAEQTAALRSRGGGGGGGGAGRAVWAGPRVVNLSSVTHRGVTAERLLALAGEAASGGGVSHSRGDGGDSGGSPYAASKLALLVLTQELERRLSSSSAAAAAPTPVTAGHNSDGSTTKCANPAAGSAAWGGVRVAAVAVNPGAVNSSIWRGLPLRSWLALRALGWLCFLSPADGAAPVMFAATSPDIHGGEYVTPYWVPGAGCWWGFEHCGPFVGPRLTAPSAAALEPTTVRRAKAAPAPAPADILWD